jgi:hypothetical protein
LKKAHAHKQAVETAQGACVAELETDNAKLLEELEQTRLTLDEVDAT